MKWLLLLILSVTSITEGFAKLNAHDLALRIAETEEECDSFLNIAMKEDVYKSLRTVCEDSLNEDKYAYITLAKVELDKYEEQGKFPVKIKDQERWVKLPPRLSAKEMEEKLKGIKGKNNLLHRKTNKRGQAVVYKQIKCELSKDEVCFKELNCMKHRLLRELKLDLKHNKEYFEIHYKGKEVNINSPPEVDCKGVKEEEEEEDFGELDILQILPAKLKVGGKNMVTKELNSVGKAALSAVTNGALGEELNTESFVGKIMSVLAPNLGGYFFSSMIGGKKKSPFSMVSRDHLDTIMVFVSNKLKKKDERAPLRKAKVKAAMEVVTKTFLHFLILSVRLKKGLSHNDPTKKKKKTNSYIETIKVTLIDSVVANMVNFVIDIMMPEDEGFGGAGGSFVHHKSVAKVAPKPAPKKEYSSGELFDDDEEGEE